MLTEGRKISGTIEFPKTFTIIGNLALALWVILDTAAFLFFSVAAGVAFLLVAIIGIYGVLKFIGCLRPCSNCKKCTLGLGRLAALYFGKRSLKDYKHTYHLGTAIFFYALIGPFPATLLFISTVQTFTVLKMAVLPCLLPISIYSALTWRTTHEL